MIDIHTHILPQIDDGSSSVAESEKLLAMLENQCVQTVVLTPHYYGQNKNITKFLANREAAFARLNSAYRGGVRLLKGCECNISTCANNDFADLEALAIEGTRYILTEMSFENEWNNELWSRLNNLLDTGLVPIIAHVEIYPAVSRKPQLAYRLIESGCLLQINCDSVLDKAKYPLIKALIEHGQVYCLGSDTHNIDRRPPHYAEAAEKLKADFGVEIFDKIQENMQNILADKQVAVKKTTPIKKSLFGKFR